MTASTSPSPAASAKGRILGGRQSYSASAAGGDIGKDGDGGGVGGDGGVGDCAGGEGDADNDGDAGDAGEGLGPRARGTTIWTGFWRGGQDFMKRFKNLARCANPAVGDAGAQVEYRRFGL